MSDERCADCGFLSSAPDCGNREGHLDWYAVAEARKNAGSTELADLRAQLAEAKAQVKALQTMKLEPILAEVAVNATITMLAKRSTKAEAEAVEQRERADGAEKERETLRANCKTFADIAIKREKERDAIDARLCECNSNLQDAQRERDKWKKRSEEDLDAVDALRKALEDARDGLEEYAAAFEWKANPIRDRIIAALSAHPSQTVTREQLATALDGCLNALDREDDKPACWCTDSGNGMPGPEWAHGDVVCEACEARHLLAAYRAEKGGK